MKDCVFCNYKEGRVVIYEDNTCFAVTSTNPINKYHVLVIPKEHYEDFTELPDALASHIFLVAKKISRAVREVCNPDAITHIFEDDISKSGYNLMGHYKFHIIPRFKEDRDTINWEVLRSEASDETRAQYAQDIKEQLENKF